MTKTTLNQISEHVFWLAPDSTTDRPTLGAIVGQDATLMVDAGNSPAHANLFVGELAQKGLAKPNYVLLTHWHWDHVFGASVFDAPLFAHTETQRMLREMVQWEWSDEALDQRVEAGIEIEFCQDMIKAELPDRSDLQLRIADVSFAKQLEFELGDVHCFVKHVGGDHASDSTVVYIPQDRILFLGDCLYEDLHHGPHNYTVDKLFPLIDDIMRFEADYFIWGHHDTPMPRSKMIAFVDLLKSIGTIVEQIGDNREEVLQALSKKGFENVDDDPIEIADAFLAGLRAQ